MIWIVLAFVLGFALGCAFLIYTDLWLEVIFALEFVYEQVLYYIRCLRGNTMSYKQIYGDEIIWVTKSDIYGGEELRISVNSNHKDNLIWLQTFRTEHEREKKLREENVAVKNAWEQYQVVKALAQKETV